LKVRTHKRFAYAFFRRFAPSPIVFGNADLCAA
jgi:hypothetical protein